MYRPTGDQGRELLRRHTEPLRRDGERPRRPRRPEAGLLGDAARVGELEAELQRDRDALALRAAPQDRVGLALAGQRSRGRGVGDLDVDRLHAQLGRDRDTRQGAAQRRRDIGPAIAGEPRDQEAQRGDRGRLVADPAHARADGGLAADPHHARVVVEHDDLEQTELARDRVVGQRGVEVADAGPVRLADVEVDRRAVTCPSEQVPELGPEPARGGLAGGERLELGVEVDP